MFKVPAILKKTPITYYAAISLKDLTPEKILGYPEVNSFEYTPDETKAIKLAFKELAIARNENFTDLIISEWIREFEKLKMNPFDVVKRIRLVKLEKKYGNTYFGEFMEVRLSDYYEAYTHQRIEQKHVESLIGKFVLPIDNLNGLSKKQYEILYELPPDRDSEKGYVLIINDAGNRAFYPVECFEILNKS